MDIPFLPVLIAIYTGLNSLTFALFAYDKLKAKMKICRMPENTLLLLAVLGPFGALLAMIGFRHKVRHMKFLLIPLFAILHVGLIFWFWPLAG
jgi:uncharacterized membrane protein YsdA (DUF1294 family)